MGRVTFTEENKTQATGDFPKLRLDKVGDRKRIVCVEDPVAEYVHRLEMPKVLNGSPVMQNRERKDGTTYEDYSMDFVGAPLCLGDEGILADKGVDPKNCPACAMAASGDLTRPPTRRFAMHVIVYNTKPGGFELQSPYGCQVVVWSFTGKKFDKLVDFQQEWGNLQNHDLLLGPCTNKEYQNYEIAIAAKAEWQASDERRRVTLETFKENQTRDLASFCGRKVERRFMEDDLQKIKDRWQEANGKGSEPRPDVVSAFDTPTLTEGLDDLLSGQTGSTSAESEPSQGPGEDIWAAAKISKSDATADLLADVGEPAADAPAKKSALVSVPAASDEPQIGKPGSSGETVSFEDLLGGLE